MTRNIQENCRSCGVEIDEPHDVEGCSIARCLYGGGQRLQCFLSDYQPTTMISMGMPLVTEIHDCGNDVWTGEYPGKAECRQYNLWVRWDEVRGWVKTYRDDPEATEDLNTLYGEGVWNRELKKWEILS